MVNPKNPVYSHDSGIVLCYNDHFREGIIFLKKAAEIAKDNAEYWAD